MNHHDQLRRGEQVTFRDSKLYRALAFGLGCIALALGLFFVVLTMAAALRATHISKADIVNVAWLLGLFVLVSFAGWRGVRFGLRGQSRTTL